MVQVFLEAMGISCQQTGGGCDGGSKMVFGSHFSPIHELHDVPQITMAYSRKIMHCRIGQNSSVGHSRAFVQHKHN